MKKPLSEAQEVKTPDELVLKEKATTEKTPTDYAEDMEGEDNSVKRLEDISGIGPAAAKKLRELGYNVMSLATSRPDIVAQEMKVASTQAKGWINQAKEAAMAKMTVMTADEYDEELKAKQYFIKTGSSEFNAILGGGIPTMSITGTSGRFSSGKTQIGVDACLDVLANLYVCNVCHVVLEKDKKCGRVYKDHDHNSLPPCKGTAVKAKAAFIETEPDTFHLDRMKEIARERKMMNIDWSNLYIFPAKQIPTAKAQYLQYKLIQELLEKGQPIALVIVDSMNAKFRAGWSESQMLPIRTREFAEHFSLIEYLASTYNIAWYLTHQVIAPVRPEQGLKMKIKFLDEYYPVGGDYVLHSVNNWIALSQVTGEVVQAELYDSSWMPKGDCYFMLTKKGLVNAGEIMQKKQEAKNAAKAKAAITIPINNMQGKP